MAGMRSGMVIFVAAVVILVGCSAPGEESGTDPSGGGSPGSGDTLSVAEAIAAGDRPVRVRGYVLIAADGTARLCTGMAGSYPPQCGPPSLVVRGLVAESLPNRESDQGLTWSSETTLSGSMSGGVLTVGR